MKSKGSDVASVKPSDHQVYKMTDMCVRVCAYVCLTVCIHMCTYVCMCMYMCT